MKIKTITYNYVDETLDEEYLSQEMYYISNNVSPFEIKIIRAYEDEGYEYILQIEYTIKERCIYGVLLCRDFGELEHLKNKAQEFIDNIGRGIMDDN